MGDAAKLPIQGKRNILITSALPYVNNVPHLGNLIGCVLSADVFARYCRMRDYNVLYICGTDEYGTATETKAMEEGCSPKQICDKYHAIHKEVYEWFNISFDEFGRTSSPQQTEVCQAIFNKLLENGWLSESIMQQLYCDTCQRFLADRLLEGNCPTPGCNYNSARGDQCEKCGKLLNPTDLVEPKCKVCHNTPHIRNTEHMFLELPKLEDKLKEYITKTSVAEGWSQNAIQATHAWLREGLKARCITRDLKWGVPVPHERFLDKVFYVWFDAPIGYVSITSCYTREWEKWWKNPKNVDLYQFMGKDNVPFHTVMFPSTLLGTGEEWTLMKTISVTEYLNYETGKFSKTKGIGVFGNDAKDTNIPVEVWRYYLLTNRPEVSDTLFTWADLQAKLNSELLNNLGNFINRVLSFIAKAPGGLVDSIYTTLTLWFIIRLPRIMVFESTSGSGYGSVIPDAQNADSHPLTKALGGKIGSYVEQYIESMEKVKLKQGLKIAMTISSEGNAYLQESQFWKLYKEDRPSCSVVMKTSLGLVYLLACLLEPFMPSFSIKVLKQLNLPLETRFLLSNEKGDVDRARTPWLILPAGHRIGTPTSLFGELKDEEVELLRNKFAGSQAERLAKAEVEAKISEKLEETKAPFESPGMAKKKSKQQNQNGQANQEELLKTLVDFTDKGNWDSFFTLRGSDDSFEWYADWPQLRKLLTENLLWKFSELDKPPQGRLPAKKPEELRILVPGCGNSRLSEHLYDLGFRNIMNVDFSKVAITNMLRKYLRERPEMKWRVMDMTDLQFPNESFDVIVDKGGLDALMEPKLGPRLGNRYLSEVKRVLTTGGKFICLTLAESHVIDILFHKFRFGWKMSVHTIDQVPPFRSPALQTFVVVLEKDSPTSISDISSFLDKYSVDSHGNQAREFHEALEKERKIRVEYLNDNDVVYTLEDLRLGAQGDITVMVPGRRIQLILGEPGVSNFSYNGILLDAKPDTERFVYQYAVFIVPESRNRDWLYTSEEGQWLIVVSSKAARLLMVFLDSSNSIFSMNDVQSDLSPLVKQLTPAHYDYIVQIPYLSAGDGIKQRDRVHQVVSDLTGPIVVEDVIYENINDDDAKKDLKYRRLIFQRAESLVQSEALLSTKASIETEKKKNKKASSRGEMEVAHNYLASPYHNGIIAGIILISSHCSVSTPYGNLEKTVVLGLGAGLLPMYMKKTLPYLKIEVVELDPVVLDVAREYFGFEEDDRLKVHIADGIKFVKDIADSETEEKSSLKVDILVVDVDSSDTSTGLTCPEVGFVDDSFILAAKESLSEQGLFIINLVSRSSSLKDGVYSRLKKVFSNIFRLKIEEDVNEVLFALKTVSPLREEQLSEARKVLATSSEWSQKVLEFSNLIEPLS